MHVMLLNYNICVQLTPGGFNHQIILARVPAMPDVWYVVDVAFGSQSPLEPIPLREPDIAKTSGGQNLLLIMTEQIHNQQNSDVLQEIFAGSYVIHRKSHSANGHLPALQHLVQSLHPAQYMYNSCRATSHPLMEHVSADATHRLRRGFIGMAGTPSKQDLVDRPQACGWYMQRYSETDKEWQDLYVFNEANLALQRDFEVMNFYLAICEESIMRKVRDILCVIPTYVSQGGRESSPLTQSSTAHS